MKRKVETTAKPRRGGQSARPKGTRLTEADVLYNNLRSQIVTGQLAAGAELPSEADLHRQHRLARGTVRRALLRLAQEGLISGGQGRKRLVLEQTPLRLAKLSLPSKCYSEDAKPGDRSGRSPSLGIALRTLQKNPRDRVIPPPALAVCSELAVPRFDGVPSVAEALGLGEADRVLWFGRLRLADERPVALQWTAIPAGLLPELETTWVNHLVPGGLTALYESHGIRRARVESLYSATLANRDEARLLGLVSGAPLIEERRVSYHSESGAGDGAPYEYLVSLYPERVALTFAWRD